MKKVLKKTRTIKVALLVFVCFTVNGIYAQGPVSPEASSFEPVDATDMVNLATGDFTYVLPLLNVPSPEGGYPIALSYHAGIAMDQEASWVGLGWNINPGAINRSVNGYPDDWKDIRFKEYFYDKGEESTFFGVSASYTSFSTGISVGASLSYSDDRGFGGSVSFGVGVGEVGYAGASIGSNGFSVNGGVGLGQSPFSIGGSVGTNGIGISLGVGVNKKGTGKDTTYGGRLNLGLNSSWSGDISVNVSYSAGEKNKKSSVGMSISSSGVSITGRINGLGTGVNFAFENAMVQSDYNIKTSNFFLPFFIPTSEGMISGAISYQYYKIDLDKLKTSSVNGPLYFKDADTHAIRWECKYTYEGDSKNQFYFTHHVDPNHVHDSAESYEVYSVKDVNSFEDINEIDFRNDSKALKLDQNNATFPNYDTYRVTAQGLSGSMQPTLYKNANLIGLKKEIEGDDIDDFEVTYKKDTNSENNFDFTPNFHFENEYTSSLLIEPVTFNESSAATDIFDYLETVPNMQATRKRGGRYVEFYTNADLATASAYTNGLLKANSTIDYGNATLFDPNGIGAFKITAADGKTYHYALPVYNHEVISRQFGKSVAENSAGEEDAFFEKRQLQKYATHWLLTAVTGPDYVDVNGNNLADEGDYGYWVFMDYGKWSDGYIWYAPHGEEYQIDKQDEDLKYYTWGRKEIYYLDQVKTRTHTALFVKEPRYDSRGKDFYYKHRLDKNTNKNIHFFWQSLLRLKEIVLLKNEDANSISKVNLGDVNSMPSPNHSETISFYDQVYESGGTRTINYSLQNNVLDRLDFNNLGSLHAKALKVIDFSTGYGYNLAKGAPFTFGGVEGRLSLHHLTFKGKGGVQLKPSYNFKYYEGSYYENQEDEWGYNRYYPQSNSLKEIQMPTGGKVKVAYEPKTFISATKHNIVFDGILKPYDDNKPKFEITTTLDPFTIYGINTNSELPVSYAKLVSCREYDDVLDPLNHSLYSYEYYNGTAKVISSSNAGKTLTLQFLEEPSFVEDAYSPLKNCEIQQNFLNRLRVTIPLEAQQTGVRVKSIETTDDLVTYRTDYDYNIPGTDYTSGIVSYIPYINELTGEVPYGSVLPPPIPMFGHVKTTSYGNNNEFLSYTQYEFATLKTKNNTLNIGFSDVIELKQEIANVTSNTTHNVSVSSQHMQLKDNLASLGRLISKASYNSVGQLVTKTINNYKSPENITQGVAQESFQTYKEIDYEANNNGSDRWLLMSSTKTTYPSVLESTTTIQAGFVGTTYFDKYDAISSQLLETTTEGSDGTKFKTEMIPAYTKYPVLGSKADAVTNKNMLTQETMTKSYIKQSENWIETSVGLSTWKPETYNYILNGDNTTVDVWRKHKTYTWNGVIDSGGLFVGFSGEADGFDWSLDATSQPSTWRQISEVTKYDEYSMTLEVKDINNNKAATKMGDANTKVIAVGNAGYHEIHYSGAEYLLEEDNNYFDGQIRARGRTSEKAHTGNYGVKITSDETCFNTTLSAGEHRTGRYKISVWVYKSNYYENARIYIGSSVTPFNGEKIIAGDWVLLNHYVDLTEGITYSISLGSDGYNQYYDDFRIHPIQSSMTSYVYNEWGELETVLGANNLGTTYEYDAIGRLVRTYAETVDNANVTGGSKKIAEHVYQYSKPIEGNIEPLLARITLDSSTISLQNFNGYSTGGSGDYSFKWYKGIGDSSTQFESTYASTSPSFQWNNISGCNIHWVKLVVTDNVYGYLEESVRIIRNGNECDEDYVEPQQ